MSVTAALLGLGLVGVARRVHDVKPLGVLENNLNHTAASAAASVSSAGLVGAVPALALISGDYLSLGSLVGWILVVSFVGTAIGYALRRSFLESEGLPFPVGTATGETLKSIHHDLHRSGQQLLRLGVGAASAAAIHVGDLLGVLRALPPPSIRIYGASLTNLTFGLSPSFLLVGLGGLAGARTGASIAAGSFIAWGMVAPVVVHYGWVEPTSSLSSWYGEVNRWMVWPGVGILVTGSMTSLVLRRPAGAERRGWPKLPPRVAAALGVAVFLAAMAQSVLFTIPWVGAMGAALATVALATVAARVTGETGIPPAGPMSKLTQLLVALLVPGGLVANLMSANVTAGASAQAADLLDDLRAGQIVGARPRDQLLAQLAGATTGAVFGSIGLLVLVPTPTTMLLTEQWPAPAVRTWTAVAEMLTGPVGIPEGARPAMVFAVLVGVVASIAREYAPSSVREFVPSATGIGIAFLIPASMSLAIGLGALAAWLFKRWTPVEAERSVLPLASGAIAGESIAGVAFALLTFIGNNLG